MYNNVLCISVMSNKLLPYHTQCLHTVSTYRAYTVPTPCLHRAYTVPTPCLHRAYTVPTPCLHRAYTEPTLMYICISCLLHVMLVVPVVNLCVYMSVINTNEKALNARYERYSIDIFSGTRPCLLRRWQGAVVPRVTTGFHVVLPGATGVLC